MGIDVIHRRYAEARAENVPTMRRAVTRVAVQEGADRKVVGDVAVCVDQALTNVVRHAYAGQPGLMEVSVLRTGRELEVVVQDRGTGLASHRADDLGHGFELIGRLARRCTISSAPGNGTEVRMTFALSRPRASADERRDPPDASLSPGIPERVERRDNPGMTSARRIAVATATASYPRLLAHVEALDEGGSGGGGRESAFERLARALGRDFAERLVAALSDDARHRLEAALTPEFAAEIAAAFARERGEAV